MNGYKNKALDELLAKYPPKYPAAMNKLEKDREELLAFYAFSAEHLVSISATNPIEPAFATVQLRSKRAKIAGGKNHAYDGIQTASVSTEKLEPASGFNLLTLVVNNVPFKTGYMFTYMLLLQSVEISVGYSGGFLQGYQQLLLSDIHF